MNASDPPQFHPVTQLLPRSSSAIKTMTNGEFMTGFFFFPWSLWARKKKEYLIRKQMREKHIAAKICTRSNRDDAKLVSRFYVSRAAGKKLQSSVTAVN